MARMQYVRDLVVRIQTGKTEQLFRSVEGPTVKQNRFFHDRMCKCFHSRHFLKKQQLVYEGDETPNKYYLVYYI